MLSAFAWQDRAHLAGNFPCQRHMAIEYSNGVLTVPSACCGCYVIKVHDFVNNHLPPDVEIQLQVALDDDASAALDAATSGPMCGGDVISTCGTEVFTAPFWPAEALDSVDIDQSTDDGMDIMYDDDEDEDGWFPHQVQEHEWNWHYPDSASTYYDSEASDDDMYDDFSLFGTNGEDAELQRGVDMESMRMRFPISRALPNFAYA